MKIKINVEKIILIIFILVILIMIGTVYVRITENSKETRYCGKVVQTYMTAAGYKVHSQRHVVFYNDSLGRNIDVRVTNQTYVNTKKGEYTCFYLNKGQLEE